MNKDRLKLIAAFSAGYATCGFVATYVMRKQDEKMVDMADYLLTASKMLHVLIDDATEETLKKTQSITTEFKFNQIVKGLE